MTTLIAKTVVAWSPSEQYSVDQIYGIVSDEAYYACPVVSDNGLLYIADNVEHQPIVNVAPADDPDAWRIYPSGSGGGIKTVPEGGTGVGTLTPYAIMFGGTTSTGNIQQITVGTSGQALVSQGPNQLPIWQDIGGTGTVESITGGPANGFNLIIGGVAPTVNPTLTMQTTFSGMVYSLGATGIRPAIASDYPTLNQSTTGNAATATLAASATKLATARSIYGNNFDGTASLGQIISSAFGGTGNAYTQIAGPSGTVKTYTLPNATCTLLTTNSAVTVGQGGTGATTFAATSLLMSGNTPTGAFQIVPNGTAGQVLVSNGSSNAPTWENLPTGSGTVTYVSGPPDTNGITIAITNHTTTPNIVLGTSVVGLAKGVSGGFVAAIPGTDYVTPTGTVLNATNAVNAQFATTAGVTTNTTNLSTLSTSNNTNHYLLFVSSSANGYQQAKLNSSITYNASTHTLNVPNLVGNLTGNASTSTSSVQAAQLQNARLIYGNTFNGTANVTGTIGVTFGGTGLAAVTPFALIAGSATGTANLQSLSLGTAGQVLTSQGSSGVAIWTDPSASTGGLDPYNPATTYLRGQFIAGDGTNGELGAIYVCNATTVTGAFEAQYWDCIAAVNVDATINANSYSATYTLPGSITGNLNSLGGYNCGTTPIFSGSANTAYGTNAFTSTTNISGTQNIVFGTNAMGSGNLTSASNNTVYGEGAGFALTTGIYNVLFGPKAGQAIDEGVGNILVGASDGEAGAFDHNLIIANPDNGEEIVNISGTNDPLPQNQMLATPIDGTGALGLRAIIPSLNALQISQITNPAAGMTVFNSTQGKLTFYTGSAWEIVQSS